MRYGPTGKKLEDVTVWQLAFHTKGGIRGVHLDSDPVGLKTKKKNAKEVFLLSLKQRGHLHKYRSVMDGVDHSQRAAWHIYHIYLFISSNCFILTNDAVVNMTNLFKMGKKRTH